MDQPGSPSTPEKFDGTEKSIGDVYNDLVDGSPSSKTEQGMAKLHALLTGGKSEHLQRAESKAFAQKKFYMHKTQILSQHHSEDIDVFPFFALPIELRLEVYFHLLVTDDRLVLTWRGPKKVIRQQKKMDIDILLTCKLCRDEGLGVLYGENVFDFEEICQSASIARPLLNRIGHLNASRIRIVLAEYSAAAEELAQANETHPQLTLPFIKEYLSNFSITLSQLRVFAISLIPYGMDHASHDLMRLQAPTIINHMPLRIQWLDAKNERERLETVASGICEREKGWVQASFYEDIDKKIEFMWSSPFAGRVWIKYAYAGKKELALQLAHGYGKMVDVEMS